MQIDCDSSNYNQTLYATRGFICTDQHERPTELTPMGTTHPIVFNNTHTVSVRFTRNNPT